MQEVDLGGSTALGLGLVCLVILFQESEKREDLWRVPVKSEGPP